LSVSDVGENLVVEKLGEDGCPLGATGGAEPASLAGKSDEKLISALWTKDAGEAGLEQPTIEVACNGGIPVDSPEAVARLESLFPDAFEGLEVGLEEWIEGGGSGVAEPIRDRAEGGLRMESGGKGGAAHAG